MLDSIPKSAGPHLILKVTTTSDASPYVVSIPGWAQKLRLTGRIVAIGTAASSNSVDVAPNNASAACRYGVQRNGATTVDSGTGHMRLGDGTADCTFDCTIDIGVYVNGLRKYTSDYHTVAAGTVQPITFAGIYRGTCDIETIADLRIGRTSLTQPFKTGSYIELYAWV